MRPPRLILGSASTSRARVLNQAGIDFTVQVSAVDEPAIVHAEEQRLGRRPTPAAEASLLAAAKAEAVAATADAAGALVLGCDSVFEFAGRSYGKPGSDEQVLTRWQQMRGGQGVLHTGHTLIDCRREQPRSWHALSSSTVHFGQPSDAELQRYIATGEPHGCAGGFTIDGHAAAFIRRVEGDANAVIGVSVAVLCELLAHAGVSISDLWSVAGASSSQHDPAL